MHAKSTYNVGLCIAWKILWGQQLQQTPTLRLISILLHVIEIRKDSSLKGNTNV